MRIIVILVASVLFLYAGEYELRLYEKVLPMLYNKKILKVFPDSTTKQDLQKSLSLTVVSDCNQADLLIGKKFHKECSTKPIFATSYKSYKRYKNVIGAFYWRKGRPQISFKKSNIRKFNLQLPNALKRYAQ